MGTFTDPFALPRTTKDHSRMPHSVSKLWARLVFLAFAVYLLSLGYRALQLLVESFPVATQNSLRPLKFDRTFGMFEWSSVSAFRIVTGAQILSITLVV